MSNDIELGFTSRFDELGDSVDEKVDTPVGSTLVHINGDRKKPAMITFHDIGQNANSCFQGFFQFSEMSLIAEKFCIYHINAPGQEDDASSFPPNFLYPTMDDLADMVSSVVDHFGLKMIICVGVGAGANILIRFAMKRPKIVHGLVAVNGTVTQASWSEWGYQKLNVHYLLQGRMTNVTVDYLMWHHFGSHWDDRKTDDLVADYYHYFCGFSSPINLGMFIDSYIRRTEIKMDRITNTLDCPLLQIVGTESPFISDTVDLNSKVNPTKSDWLKVSDSSGLVLDDKPDKATEAIMLFLQGLGYLGSISYSRWVQRRHSQSSLPMQAGDMSPVGPLTGGAAFDAAMKHKNLSVPLETKVVQDETGTEVSIA